MPFLKKKEKEKRKHAIPPKTSRHPDLYWQPCILSILLYWLWFSHQAKQNPTKLLGFQSGSYKNTYNFYLTSWKRSETASMPALSLLMQGIKELDFDPLKCPNALRRAMEPLKEYNVSQARHLELGSKVPTFRPYLAIRTWTKIVNVKLHLYQH